MQNLHYHTDYSPSPLHSPIICLLSHPPKYIPTVRKPSLLIQNQNQIKRKKMFKQKNTKKRQKPQTGTWASRLCALCQTPPSPRLPSSLAPPIVFFSFHRLFRSLGKVTRFGYVQDGGV